MWWKSFAPTVLAFAMKVASAVGPRGMRVVARFNKYLTNPIQGLWASRVPYYALIEHTGRKSGRAYRTPVMAFVHSSQIAIVLNYGTNSDWVRNIQASGSAVVVHRGRRFQLTDPQIVSADSSDLPEAVREAANRSSTALIASLAPASE